MTGTNDQKITAYYRAKGKILTRQEYNVSGGNNSNYQHRPQGRRLFYTYDALGSVATLSTHTAKLDSRYRYDAYGTLVQGDMSENEYGFTGKRFDKETETYHFHYRQFDAQTGVWMTPDPIGVLGGNNFYSYVANNPINRRDLLGLMSAGEAGTGNPGSYGGTTTESDMRDSDDNDPGEVDDYGEPVEKWSVRKKPKSNSVGYVLDLLDMHADLDSWKKGKEQGMLLEGKEGTFFRL